MPRLAANLSMLFTEREFLDRFAAAAGCGFAGVEFLFPHAHPAAAIAARLEAHRLENALFNAPPGDWEAGERGLAGPLRHQADAHAVIAAVGAANVRVQLDLYHCQIVEGDVATRIRRHLPGAGYVQIAGVPERHEPDRGELRYPYLLGLRDALGYAGSVGCEYRPAGATEAGLGWAEPYGVRAPDPSFPATPRA